uniref:Uncharacterized protein LOC111107159 n=1 Tax=Crassostrea virginica TaxID=6565 RepID=A0A8B8B3C1_CRAVI|nr:uncharacterized protein LOC111107159 [Crassostrea virginica]XP_022297905.1 uncharacterized protein LOC111107159 [Crassostrea virginica]
MPKKRAPLPPSSNDTPPDSPPPPPPGKLHPKHSSSSSSLRSITSTGSGSGFEMGVNRQNPRHLPFFYSNFTSQEEVCQFLQHHSKKQPGYFLLRPSFSSPSTLSISVIVHDKTVRHTNIRTDGGRCFYLVPEVKFPSVQELVLHYGQNEVKNLQKVNNVRFLYPLSKRRDSRAEDGSGSSTSGQSHYQSAEEVAAASEDRPALPSRPRDLPRLSSQTSIGLSSPSTSSLNSFGSPDGVANGRAFTSQTSIESGASGGRHRLGHHNSTSSIDSRPPAKLPQGHVNKDSNTYYSSPRNVDEDITDRLKDVLRQNEVCDCGIPRDKAELPLGWTLHRSKDPGSYGKLFFQNNKGLTTWKLPAEVESRLNIVQQQNIEQLRNERIPVPGRREVISHVTQF